MVMASARAIGWFERGLVPQGGVCAGICRLLQQGIDERKTARNGG
jgi:hypothetical protein